MSRTGRTPFMSLNDGVKELKEWIGSVREDQSDIDHTCPVGFHEISAFCNNFAQNVKYKNCAQSIWSYVSYSYKTANTKMFINYKIEKICDSTFKSVNRQLLRYRMWIKLSISKLAGSRRPPNFWDLLRARTVWETTTKLCLAIKLDVMQIFLHCRPRMLTRDLFAVANLLVFNYTQSTLNWWS